MNVPVCFIVSVQAQSEALCLCKYVWEHMCKCERTEDNH